MRTLSLLAASSLLAFAFVSTTSADTRKKDADKDLREVHIVGIYEGVTKTGDMIHGGRAFVTVERPKKLVTLVLTSHSPVTWHVAVGNDTHIEQVVIGGTGRQAVQGLSEKTKIVEAYNGKVERPLIYAFRMTRPEFRMLVRQVGKLTSQSVSSFHGAYRYEHERGPFVIDRVDDDPRLSPDYPQVSPQRELPKLEFRALHMAPPAMHGAERDISVGGFTLAGPVKDSLRPLPKGIKRLAYDPAAKQYYGLTGRDVVEVNLDKGETKVVAVGLELPPFIGLSDITFDTKRQRLLLVEGNYIHAYSPSKKVWTAVCEKPRDLKAIAYAEKEDCIYGLTIEGTEDGARGVLCTLNANGAVLDRVGLGEPIMPGMLELQAHSPWFSVQLVAVGDHVIMLTSPWGPNSEYVGHEGWYIFLVNPKTGDVKLAYKQMT